MRRTTHGNVLDTSRPAANNMAWRRLIRRSLSRVAKRIARYKLELTLSRYRHIAASLRAQVVNDLDALDYIRSRQQAVLASLKELQS